MIALRAARQWIIPARLDVKEPGLIVYQTAPAIQIVRKDVPIVLIRFATMV